MIKVVGDSIDIGRLPFNLYYKDKHAFPTLFCRAGYEITPERKQVLSEHNRDFYVQHEELANYLDYAADRIIEIINNPNIRIMEKLDLMKSVGTRMRKRIINDPVQGANQTRARGIVESHMDVITETPEVSEHLFSVAQTGEYLLARSFNVCTLCLMMGRLIFKRSKRQLRQLGMGALLLDVGMTKVSRDLIEKTSTLNKEEFDEVRLHPLHSDLILSQNNFRSEVLAMVRQHHERMDGSGYPHGVKGDMIHPFAQIAGIADTYDAITSDRPYSSMKSHTEALSEMAAQIEKFNFDYFKLLLQVVYQDDRLVKHFLIKHNLT